MLEVGQDVLTGEGQGQAADAEGAHQRPQAHTDDTQGVDQRQGGKGQPDEATDGLGRGTGRLLVLASGGP